MVVEHTARQFADELAELHDGSISLFVTLPIFREHVQAADRRDILTKYESVIAEHLAHLDGIMTCVPSRVARRDGDLTSLLFRALTRVRALPLSEARDQEILAIVGEAQLFLTGSCSFALRFARQCALARAIDVLEAALHRLASLAAEFEPSCPMTDPIDHHHYTGAVA